MALDAGPPADCESFAYIHGEKTCDVNKIAGLVKTAKDRFKR